MELYTTREVLKRKVIEAFAAQEEVYQIRLFGREAEGRIDGYSDIDLIICSNDPARTQARYRQVFNSISPVWATFPLISTAESFSEMILLAGCSPYHKIDFSIGNAGKEDWRSLIVYDSPDKPRTACTRLTEVDIQQDVAYKLSDVLFSVARFTKCLFRGDMDMYRRWQSITNLTLVLLYEKYFGWQPETLTKKLGAYDLKCLSERLEPDDREVVHTIYSPAGDLDLTRSYHTSISLFIELSRQKAGYFEVILNEDFIATIKQFLDTEINRFRVRENNCMSEQSPEQKYLAAMASIERLSKMVRTAAYIWGGLSIDIHQGQFLREHSDIDYFIVDLHRLSGQFQNALRHEGWDVKVILDDHLLIATKNGLKLHLGSIEIGDAAQWRHNGNQGTITFPGTWLRKEAVSFYGISVHVVEPELGYVLKTHPNLMNPAWTFRAKDEPDLSLLEEMLRQKGVDVALLAVQVNSNIRTY